MTNLSMVRHLRTAILRLIRKKIMETVLYKKYTIAIPVMSQMKRIQTTRNVSPVHLTQYMIVEMDKGKNKLIQVHMILNIPF